MNPKTSCPDCGAVVSSGSQFCRSCGAPLQAAHDRRPIWPWVVGGLAVMAIAASVALLVVAGGDDGEPATASPESGADLSVVLVGYDEAGIDPFTDSVGDGYDTVAEVVAGGSAPPSEVDAVGAGFDRLDGSWVSILESLPEGSTTLDDAQAVADGYEGRGIEADVLYSSSYSSLNPGYWVVYSGVFSSEEPGASNCRSLQPRIDVTCYQRFVDGYQDVGVPGAAAEPPPVIGSGGSVPADEVGLYGGSLEDSSCDADQLVSFLEQDDAKAAAWAEVQGIDPAEIGSFVDGLTPVVLRADAVVTNHGFTDGAANPFVSVLQAGSAIMVDDEGVPRVRCACGNPLGGASLEVLSTSGAASGQGWDGYVESRVVGIDAGATGEFTLVDDATGTLFTRPAGTDGNQDVGADDAEAEGDRARGGPANPCDFDQLYQDLVVNEGRAGSAESVLNVGDCAGGWVSYSICAECLGDVEQLGRLENGAWTSYTGFPTSICQDEARADGVPARYAENFPRC